MNRLLTAAGGHQLSRYFLFVAYEKSHNRLWVSEIMQLKVFSVMLRSVRINFYINFTVYG